MAGKNLIILIITSAILLGLAYYFFVYQKGYEAPAEKEVEKTPLEKSLEGVGENPLEKMPETNPFKDVVNPFKDVYKNPFK